MVFCAAEESRRVPPIRTPGRNLSRRAAGHAAARVLRLPVAIHRGPAALHPADDALHRRHRRVRGAAVRDARPARRLAGTGGACPALGHASAQNFLLLLGGAGRQPAGRRAVRPAQVPGAVRELPDAAALELPPADARPEHELLPGRVRGPRRDQGDADGARRARRLADRHRHPRVHRHLLRDHARDRRHVRPAHARARSSAGSRSTSAEPRLLRAAPGQGRGGTGRRALADDRTRDRRVHQHRDGEAVLARQPRGRLRARFDAGVHADGLRAGPPGERLRDHQPRAQHGADRAPRPAWRCGCGCRARWASARSPPRAPWHCA